MGQIQGILFAKIVAFVSSTALLSMAANAVISTAPAKLPGWREFPQWSWTWIISAARLFWSLHHPQIPQTPLPNETAAQPQKE